MKFDNNIVNAASQKVNEYVGKLMLLSAQSEHSLHTNIFCLIHTCELYLKLKSIIYKVLTYNVGTLVVVSHPKSCYLLILSITGSYLSLLHSGKKLKIEH